MVISDTIKPNRFYVYYIYPCSHSYQKAPV